MAKLISKAARAKIARIRKSVKVTAGKNGAAKVTVGVRPMHVVFQVEPDGSIDRIEY